MGKSLKLLTIMFYIFIHCSKIIWFILFYYFDETNVTIYSESLNLLNKIIKYGNLHIFKTLKKDFFFNFINTTVMLFHYMFL